jgi:hypothetical protein
VGQLYLNRKIYKYRKRHSVPLSIFHNHKERRFYGMTIGSSDIPVGPSRPKANITTSMETIDRRRVC